jgi:pimeloyl-ACP methyl ester carboxylesterase
LSLTRTLLIAALVVAAAFGAARLLRVLDKPEVRLEAETCWFGKPATRTVECHHFIAPESRGTASNRSVRLPVVILRSPSTPPGEPPVLHLMGGPGQPAGIETTAQIGGWSHMLDGAAWARDRDHILVDTRGIGGRASPRLRCDVLSDLDWVLALEALKHDPKARDASIRKTVEGCRERFTRQGIDLAAYDTATVARDLIDLRLALKLPSWTLYGISYGGRLALELMRQDPKGVHAAILDSALPPDAQSLAGIMQNMQQALNLLYADCKADPACQGAYPELRQDLEGAVRRLHADPVTVTIRQPDGSRTGSLTVDDGIFLQVIEYGLMSGEWLAFLPGIINDTGKGGSVLLAHLASRLLYDSYWETNSNALLLSTLCREELPFNPPISFAHARATYPLLRAMFDEDVLRAQCAHWPSGTAPAAFRAPVKSDVPTLLISGAYDTRTPPAYAERQATRLTTGYRIVLRNRGHSPSPSSACAQAAMAAFLESPGVPAAPPCTQRQKPPRFMTRGGPSDHIERL